MEGCYCPYVMRIAVCRHELSLYRSGSRWGSSCSGGAPEKHPIMMYLCSLQTNISERPSYPHNRRGGRNLGSSTTHGSARNRDAPVLLKRIRTAGRGFCRPARAYGELAHGGVCRDRISWGTCCCG